MIRAAARGELPLLTELALRSKASWGYTAEFMAACRRELTLAPDERRASFVAIAAGCVVGFYSLRRIDEEVAELEHLFVEPSAMRRGHGKALLADAVRRARASGARTLLIEGDPHAAPFYRAAGAAYVGTRPSGSIVGRVLPLFAIALAPPDTR